MVEQVPLAEIATQHDKLVEQAVFRSVRGMLEVGPVKPVSKDAGR